MLGLSAATLISRAIVLLVAFTVHELAHAVVAVRLGDDTPRRAGRLTLNPLAHLDPIGTLLLLMAGFGWAKPVPVNPYYLQYGAQLGMAIVAAAGPLSNLLLAMLGAIPFRLGLLPVFGGGGGGFFPTPAEFMREFVVINLVLMLFNLLPIAPLDGSKILRGFAPRQWDTFLMTLEQWGPFILLALVFLGRGALSFVIGVPTSYLFGLLMGV
jgi:Zn-dependent protease